MKKKNLYNFLNKDVKEINKIALSLVCIGILSLAGYVSYYFTNNSFAFFTDSLSGSKTIELGVNLCTPEVYIEDNDRSGANAPDLADNMIPVYYDECNEVWKKADEENQNGVNKWYNYSKKKWANSVTVTNEKRDEYKNANPGTEISMNDILTMQVWIPRYKYTVWNYNADGEQTSEPQAINIKFEEGTGKTGEITCTDSISGINGDPSETCTYNSTPCTDSLCNGKTYTHPAFTFGDDELRGIWVGKFENSATSIPTTVDNTTLRDVIVKPDVQSWRNSKVGTFESSIMKMNDASNIYGFSSNYDTHMMKNSEWGAVAYLSHSKYGINSEVYINNSSSYYTGRSGGNVGGSTPINEVYENQTSTEQENAYGFYTYDGYLLNYNTNTKSTIKDMTKVASTTGNIYGIYDMSGGTAEYTMGNIVSNDGTTMMSGYNSSFNSGYTGKINAGGNYLSYTGTYEYPANKYLDKYSFGTSGEQINRSKLGDAIKEVKASSHAWYSDNNSLACSPYPWITRGGSYSNHNFAGVFNHLWGEGISGGFSSRLVIALPSSLVR